MLINVLIFCLFVISGIVAIGLLQKRNMWPFICTYWITLMIKNFIDFIMRMR